MNAADRKEFDLIHNKIDDIKKDIDDLKQSMNNAHQRNDENLEGITLDPPGDFHLPRSLRLTCWAFMVKLPVARQIPVPTFG